MQQAARFGDLTKSIDEASFADEFSVRSVLNAFPLSSFPSSVQFEEKLRMVSTEKLVNVVGAPISEPIESTSDLEGLEGGEDVGEHPVSHSDTHF